MSESVEQIDVRFSDDNFYDEEDAPEIELLPCGKCGRNFDVKVLPRHHNVCTKVKQRKAFDSKKQRLAEIEKIAIDVPSPRKNILKPKKTDWRWQHEQFIRNIRAAKSTSKGAPPVPAPPVINPDYVQCPHCQRRFNESAAERHIEFCKEQKSRIPRQSDSKYADKKEKQNKRATYKPPPPGKMKKSAGSTPKARTRTNSSSEDTPTKARIRTNSDSGYTSKDESGVIEKAKEKIEDDGKRTLDKWGNDKAREEYAGKNVKDERDGNVTFHVTTEEKSKDTVSKDDKVEDKHENILMETPSNQGRKSKPFQPSNNSLVERGTKSYTVLTGRRYKISQEAENGEQPGNRINSRYGKTLSDSSRTSSGESLSGHDSSDKRNSRSGKTKPTWFEDLKENDSGLLLRRHLKDDLESADSGLDLNENYAHSIKDSPVGVVRPSSRHTENDKFQEIRERTLSSSRRKMANFCHDCGSRYPVQEAKFCCDCGVRRMALT